MTTVKEIEVAVEGLSGDRLAEFRRWFEEFDATLWDRKFERDVREGNLDSLADQALVDLREGRCTEL
jgi:hypothetical protein